MTEYFDVLKRAKLFWGLTIADFDVMLPCLGAGVKHYGKHEKIFSEGEQPHFIGVILSGEVQIQKTDYAGNSNIVSRHFSGDTIAANACYAALKRLPFDVECACETTILTLDAARLVHPCASVCACHTQLVQNMLAILADHSLNLADKIDILTKRTLREKILAYLYVQSRRAASRTFSIPLTRSQMAQYLSVNRSALSRELATLKSRNILDFSANRFTLK